MLKVLLVLKIVIMSHGAKLGGKMEYCFLHA